MSESNHTAIQLPGLDCGICGYRKCDDLAQQLPANPELAKRCIHLSGNRVATGTLQTAPCAGANTASCTACPSQNAAPPAPAAGEWKDSLGRDIDFHLEHFPEDPGPREIIIPHNPMITREMEVALGDILIGRPLGMSCGCPITHCGVVTAVDARTGVITWCVTGPLGPREKGYKDIGYYIAEAYEGIVKRTRSELRIGMRYYFQPRMCMLQWRHSGLLNYLNRLPGGYQVRLEGLFIG